MDDTIIIDNTEFVNAPLDGGGVTYYIFSYIRGGGGWLGAILTNFLLKDLSLPHAQSWDNLLRNW